MQENEWENRTWHLFHFRETAAVWVLVDVPSAHSTLQLSFVTTIQALWQLLQSHIWSAKDQAAKVQTSLPYHFLTMSVRLPSPAEARGKQFEEWAASLPSHFNPWHVCGLRTAMLLALHSGHRFIPGIPEKTLNHRRAPKNAPSLRTSKNSLVQRTVTGEWLLTKDECNC